VVWIVTSAGFAFYVANLDSYNKTYGTLGGVIIFLARLWISNRQAKPVAQEQRPVRPVGPGPVGQRRRVS
jgi:membrane protein